MAFPPQVKERALVACGRFCCLCHEFCGSKMECNHIVAEAEGGPDTFENCIPLCFNCHAEVGAYNPKHPKGNKFSPTELTAHRDRWYQKVANPTSVYVDSSLLEVDRALFARIRTSFPSSFMLFFRDHDYGGSFDAKYHEVVSDFLRECNDPAFEFLDERMQGCFRMFRGAIEAFQLTWDNRLWIDADQLKHGVRILAIPREWINGRDEELQIKRYEEARKALNSGATMFYEAYGEFVRNGRRILGVA